MSKPQAEVKDKEYYKDIHFLYEIINSLNDVEELKLFLKDILTKSELRMLKRRCHIVNLLEQGLDIRAVAETSNTSTQTVFRIKQILEEENGGLRLAINKVNDTLRREKIKGTFNKKRGGSKFVKGWF
ncbi:MAG TPA: Trp family transcriptional regulator [Patescibacteria group bacterium]|nr:Trp family transcriptional regulator [Patescibacteria group bacterium]